MALASFTCTRNVAQSEPHNKVDCWAAVYISVLLCRAVEQLPRGVRVVASVGRFYLLTRSCVSLARRRHVFCTSDFIPPTCAEDWSWNYKNFRRLVVFRRLVDFRHFHRNVIFPQFLRFWGKIHDIDIFRRLVAFRHLVDFRRFIILWFSHQFRGFGWKSTMSTFSAV